MPPSSRLPDLLINGIPTVSTILLIQKRRAVMTLYYKHLQNFTPLIQQTLNQALYVTKLEPEADFRSAVLWYRKREQELQS